MFKGWNIFYKNGGLFAIQNCGKFKDFSIVCNSKY